MRFLSLITLLAACSRSGGEFDWPEETADAVLTHARIVEATTTDTLAAVEALDASLGALVDAPTAASLDTARAAWLDSREPYLQSEVFRFYGGPIDEVEGWVNAWPLDEAFVDYVEGDPDAGLINGDGAIDRETLLAVNARDAEDDISTGYHAVEFLLWGQDLDPDGPGARPFTDYVPGTGGTAAHQDRRGTYLRVVGDLLVEHLGEVAEQWTEAGTYRSGFEADPELAFERMLTGAIVLSGFETGGERLQAALDSGSQEDEHSCFSDNTHRDMIQDVRGVSNVWNGRYVAVDGSVVEGAGIRDVVEAVDPELAGALDDQLATSLALAEGLGVPFDRQIVPGAPGNDDVAALIVSLQDQEALLFEVFDTFGLTVEIPE